MRGFERLDVEKDGQPSRPVCERDGIRYITFDKTTISRTVSSRVTKGVVVARFTDVGDIA